MWLNGLWEIVFSVPDAEPEVCSAGSQEKKVDVKWGRRAEMGWSPGPPAGDP